MTGIISHSGVCQEIRLTLSSKVLLPLKRLRRVPAERKTAKALGVVDRLEDDDGDEEFVEHGGDRLDPLGMPEEAAFCKWISTGSSSLLEVCVS